MISMKKDLTDFRFCIKKYKGVTAVADGGKLK